MNKVVGIVGLSLVGTTAVVGGTYLLLNNKGSINPTLLKNINTFQDNSQQLGCVESIFSGLNNATNSTQQTQPNKL